MSHPERSGGQAKRSIACNVRCPCTEARGRARIRGVVEVGGRIRPGLLVPPGAPQRGAGTQDRLLLGNPASDPRRGCGMHPLRLRDAQHPACPRRSRAVEEWSKAPRIGPLGDAPPVTYHGFWLIPVTRALGVLGVSDRARSGAPWTYHGILVRGHERGGHAVFCVPPLPNSVSAGRDAASRRSSFAGGLRPPGIEELVPRCRTWREPAGML